MRGHYETIKPIHLQQSQSLTDGSQFSKKSQHRAYKFALKIFITLFILGGITFGAYVFYDQYKDKILPRITIAGIEVGAKTPQEAKTLIQNHINELDSQGPKIVYKDKTFQPKLSELGIVFNADKVVQDAYNYGRNNDIKVKTTEVTQLAKQGIDFPLIFTTNDQKIDSFAIKVADNLSIKPQNASIKLIDNQFIVTVSKKGYGIDKEQFKSAITGIINDGNPTEYIFDEKNISLEFAELNAPIDELDVLSARIQADKFLQTTPIDMVFEDYKFTITKDNLQTWLSFKEDTDKIRVEIDNPKIENLAQTIAKEIGYNPTDREIKANGTITKEGQDGRGVDEKKLVQDIITRITSGIVGPALTIPVFSIARKEKIINPPFEADLYEGKYIDINLSEQVMRLIDNHNVIEEYTVSTGKWSTPTPVGIRYIENKTERAWSNKYKLYMPYWNSLGGGYGIHELPEWPNGYKEGENHLGTPVSHGCIRLGVGPAEDVYNWAPVGTPVNIHR